MLLMMFIVVVVVRVCLCVWLEVCLPFLQFGHLVRVFFGFQLGIYYFINMLNKHVYTHVHVHQYYIFTSNVHDIF